MSALGTVAAVGALQLAYTVLAGVVWVLGWTSLACLVLVLVRLCCAWAGDRRLARMRKQNRKPAPELGDDVLDVIARWHQAEFDEGLERLLTEEEKRRG